MMLVVGKISVEEQIARTPFACDLQRCRGACCTLPGGRGAPLEDEELLKIEEAIPHARKYLSREHAEVLRTTGAIEGIPGSYATTCIDNKACVFVYYDAGIARCSLEKAFLEGASDFRKPLSCHLFPIRVSSNGNVHVRYEEITECEDAKVLGKKKGVRMFAFLKDALVRKFGEQWYREFEKMCNDMTAR